MRTEPIENESKTNSCIFILVGLLSLQITGCGEFSYKRGAGATDLQLARKDCQATHQDAGLVEKCLENSGWIVRDFDQEDPLMAVAFVDNNRSLDAPSPTAASSTEPGNEASGMPVTNASRTEQAPRDQSRANIAKPKDPMDIFLVNSWWNVGKGPDALKADTNECVSMLGEPHRPDNVTFRTTRGFLLCMRERGWRALQSK